MKEKKQNDLSVLLRFAGSYKGLTFLGLGLSAVAMMRRLLESLRRRRAGAKDLCQI